MRALRFDGEQVRLAPNHPEPIVASGEVLLRTRRAAVGSLDVAVTQGRFGFTGVLGHQFVADVMGGEHGLADGQRVVGTIHAVCGACDLCRGGLPAHCREQTLLGLDGRDGCLADRFCLPESSLIAVPDDVDDDHALFAQPLAAALQGVRQAVVAAGRYVTVLGDGVVALLTAQLLVAGDVAARVIGHHPEHLAWCEKWGIAHRLASDVGRRSDQDVVIDCTDDPMGLDLALDLVRPRGRVILKSLSSAPGGSGVDLARLVRHEIELVGSFRGPLAEAVGRLQRREVDVVSLLGRRMRLDDGPQLLRVAAEPGQLPVVVEV